MSEGAFKFRPFTFDRSFDEAEIERARKAAIEEEKRQEEAAIQEELERNPPPPTFSMEELEAAKAAAFEEGRQAGQSETLEGLQQQALIALQTITGQLAVMQDRQSLLNETASAQMAKITSDIFERLLPEYVRRHGDMEIIALVKDCLEPLEGVGRVSITIPESLNEVLSDKLEQAAQEAGFEGRLLLKPSSDLGLSDVRIDWGLGGTERNMEKTWNDIEEAIQHCLNHTSRQEEVLTAAQAPIPVQDALSQDTIDGPADQNIPAEEHQQISEMDPVEQEIFGGPETVDTAEEFQSTENPTPADSVGETPSSPVEEAPLKTQHSADPAPSADQSEPEE